jgi:hypothetical protein
VFFDPSANHPRPLDEDLLTRETEMVMRSAGIDEATIYAWHKTGLLVSEENEDLVSGEDLEDWLNAVFEYNGEAISLHLREAHGQDARAGDVEAARIYAETGDRVCPRCGEHLEYPESAWD